MLVFNSSDYVITWTIRHPSTCYNSHDLSAKPFVRRHLFCGPSAGWSGVVSDLMLLADIRRIYTGRTQDTSSDTGHNTARRTVPSCEHHISTTQRGRHAEPIYGVFSCGRRVAALWKYLNHVADDLHQVVQLVSFVCDLDWSFVFG